jgi:hypothetical protein
MTIWYMLWQFGIFYGHLVTFIAIWVVIWYISCRFGTSLGIRVGTLALYPLQEKKNQVRIP